MKKIKKQKSPVPSYIFSTRWLEKEFKVRKTKGARAIQRLRLERYSNYCIMWVPGKEHVRKIILERIAAIESYDAPVQGLDIPVPSVFFSKEWREGNFPIQPDDLLRGEEQARLKKYVGAAIMFQPKHQGVRKLMLARLAAIEAYDAALGKTKK